MLLSSSSYTSSSSFSRIFHLEYSSRIDGGQVRFPSSQLQPSRTRPQRQQSLWPDGSLFMDSAEKVFIEEETAPLKSRLDSCTCHLQVNDRRDRQTCLGVPPSPPRASIYAQTQRKLFWPCSDRSFRLPNKSLSDSNTCPLRSRPGEIPSEIFGFVRTQKFELDQRRWFGRLEKKVALIDIFY